MKQIVKMTALGLGVALSVQAMAADIARGGYQTVNPQVSTVTYSETAFDHLSSDQQKQIATVWSLDHQDYAHYLSLMQNTPSGRWYKNLDPAEVLMLNAKDDQSRMKYALIVAKNTHDRGDHELAAQKAYDQAWQELYPNQPRVIIPGQTPQSFRQLHAGDALLFFTKIDDSSSNATLQQLFELIAHHSDVRLQIFIMGNPDSKAIEAWANQQKIPTDLYGAGVIKMQLDKGYLATLSQSALPTPVLMLNHNQDLTLVSSDEFNHWLGD